MTKVIHYAFFISSALFFYKIYLKFYEFKKILWKNNRLMDLEMLRLTKAMDLEEHDILMGGKFY
jgi:hypothetical protein